MLVLGTPRIVMAQRQATWGGVPSALADSSRAHRTWAGTGTVIGGVSGALVGAVAFIHFTYRNSSVDNGTALAGVGMVGASLLGSAGALLGRLIGSAIRR